jgi:two-component system cell cycle response regulator DivK
MPSPKRTSSGARAKGRVVLLVEDVADVRSVLAEMLQREGFAVVEASNGHEAIVYASSVTIDAIVMDLSLPLLDGVEATRVLRSQERTRAIPIVALTGYPIEPVDRREFDDVLAKPCHPDALVQRLRAVLARAAKTGGGTHQA